MTLVSRRILRFGLAFLTALAASALPPISNLLPLVMTSAAEDGGLGPGGATFAYNYVLAISVALAFIFGFAIRDVLQRRATRARTAKKTTPAPPRP